MRAARQGFTLLEVVLALMLTAVSVTIAGSALHTATIASDRIADHRDGLERDARVRSMLTDMLRHPPRAELVDEPLLQITSAPRGGSHLVFLSQGVRAPFGTGAIWRVSVLLADSGLVLDAETIGATRETARLHTMIADVRELSVHVLEPTRPTALGADRAAWRTDWPLAQSRPAMIALSFGEARPPLVVSLDPLGGSAMARMVP